MLGLGLAVGLDGRRGSSGGAVIVPQRFGVVVSSVPVYVILLLLLLLLGHSADCAEAGRSGAVTDGVAVQ